MRKTSIKLIALATLSLPMSSCLKDLNRKPLTELTSANLYENFGNYKSVLAKIYAGLATTGQKGPAGDKDISAINDEGFTNYLRILWNLQEMPTDVVKCQWGDVGLPVINTGDWSSDNPFVKGMYYRLFFQIALTNEFLRELTDDKLSSRNITGADLAEAKAYRAEARFMRALAYFHALDLFGGGVPFITEESSTAELPKPGTNASLYAYIESELKAIENEMKAPGTNEYGRADQAATWMLLSKLYLNAKTYIGAPNYIGASTYAAKVINSNKYSLDSDYGDLFKADNHTSKEIIFATNHDGNFTRSYGGTTFLAHACVGGSMLAENYGINGGWAGMRTTKQFVSLFPDATGNIDKRGMFHTDGQKLEMEKLTGDFSQGYALAKFKNITKAGVQGKDPLFVDIDFPIFRLAEAYLNYAEAFTEGGVGESGKALEYVNKIRNRAFGGAIGEIASGDLNGDFILDERGRELYYECTRRTDLIRFNKFTEGSYLWAWKGGVKEGAAMASYKKLYPIPIDDLTANTNLKQNQGY
jgi:starch-binding outer membrane protein, SusD/RagB family